MGLNNFLRLLGQLLDWEKLNLNTNTPSFRDKFQIPIPDTHVVDVNVGRPALDCPNLLQ